MANIRLALESELATVGELIGACMHESYRRTWNGSVEALAQDIRDRRVTAALAADAIGMITWEPSYDLHHCVHGGNVCELYVVPGHRGYGIAAQLVAFACQEVATGGGRYLKGTAVASAAPLYNRVAWGWDCREVILGGRAFRTFADLAGASAREIVRNLPDPAWNHE
jgi:GNAT superfamily N-acetyltransferase